MSRSCAIIVCDHGLGHVRRCAIMAKELERSGKQVTLFASSTSLKRLQRAIPYTIGITIKDFATQTTPERIRQGLQEAVEWVDRLPNLENFETVICDNLPEILARRPDATISAQFFWHNVIEDAAQEYADYCEQLLDQHKPKVIGCELFAMEAVCRQPGFQPVGLYKNPYLIAATEAASSENRTSLLVTGGTTPSVRKKLQRTIDVLSKAKPKSYQRVYVDPELMPEQAPHWMLAADFTVDMYCKLKAAICRPGLGVITDLITVGALIYPLYESNNREMAHNAEILKSI